MDGGKLKLTGDVETVLDLPASAVTDGFSFAFSDGTLLKGHHDIGSGRCHFAVAAEGAGIVRIMREGRHDGAKIDGQIEWMTLACGSRTLRSEEHTSELQSLMRISYVVYCLQKKRKK